MCQCSVMSRKTRSLGLHSRAATTRVGYSPSVPSVWSALLAATVLRSEQTDLTVPINLDTSKGLVALGE